MRSTRFLYIGVIVLGSFTWGIAQHGHGASGGHMGSGPVSSGKSDSDHGATGSNQSQKPTPEQLLNKNTKLTANLQKLLPPTMTPQQACSGFRNLGQCVAAIHVANNHLGISFLDLRAKMTGPNGESLGKAIQALKPTANAGAEKKKAEKQAKHDMNDSDS